jgi:hypothetical protein
MNMQTFSKNRWVGITFSGLLILAILTGCGGGGAPADTNNASPQNVDPNLVYTSGAQTVVAQITVDAANRPAPTEAPPTAAPLPTLAPLPVQPTTDLQVPANGQQPNLAVPTGAAIPTLAPLSTTPIVGALQPTAAAAAANTQYKAEWVSQTPADNSKIGKSTKFTMQWTVKNTGTVTWTKSYMLRFYAGTQLGDTTVVNFPSDVLPGKDVVLSARLTAPASAGDYISNWVLTTPDGRNFYSVNITFKVP